MSEGKATYSATRLTPEGLIPAEQAPEGLIPAEDTRAGDPFGLVSVFAVHLGLSLETSHPEQAAKAAYAAVEAYLKSYTFLEINHKGSEAPEYRMVRKRESGGPGKS